MTPPAAAFSAELDRATRAAMAHPSAAPPDPAAPRRAMTQGQAADRLGVSVRTLQRWRGEGQGPAYVCLGPRRIAYQATDLETWLAACRHDPGNV